MAGTSGNLGKMTSSPRSKSQSRAQPYSGAKRRRSLRSIFAAKKPIAIEVMEVSGNRVMTRSKLYRRLTTPNVPSITTRSAGLQKAANKNCKEVLVPPAKRGLFQPDANRIFTFVNRSLIVHYPVHGFKRFSAHKISFPA